MTWIVTISIFSALAFLAIAPTQTIAHLIACGVRRLRGKAAGLRWGIVVRGLLGLTVPVLFVLGAARSSDPLAGALFGIGIIFLCVVFVVLPLWYLFSAYRRRGERSTGGAYVIALLSLLAMPTVASFLTYLVMTGWMVSTQQFSELDRFTRFDSHYFTSHPDEPESSCRLFLDRTLDAKVPIGAFDLPRSEADTPFNFINGQVGFWFDQTLSGALFDFVEVFDCRLSAYGNNPDQVVLSSMVFLYRLFAEAIVVSIVLMPLGGLSRFFGKFLRKPKAVQS